MVDVRFTDLAWQRFFAPPSVMDEDALAGVVRLLRLARSAFQHDAMERFGF
ncbi:MAG TPA: hypothetical protein VG758_27245 [Hyphomicrobiaceae bacterium]|jgi:hypothetical protein|nr:hypothetical protein [Hyphomicrobiaceae bacterium]